MLEEPSSADRRQVPVVSECFVAGSASALSQDPKSAFLETEFLDCSRMTEHLGSQRVATNASCGAQCAAMPTGCRRTVPYRVEWPLFAAPVHTRGNKTSRVKSLDDRPPPCKN